MAFSARTLKFMKVLYWVLMTAIHLFICYLLFTNDRSITGVIWLILGFILIYVMYWVYFPPGNPGSQWPPYLTACPDYLTLLAPNACVDFVGLGSPQLRKSDPANPPSPSDSAYVFNPSGTIEQKAARAQQYGLSWDGIN
jgi:hypothetical protein